jgi:hypothetical protein
MKAKLIKKDDGYNLAIEQPQGRLLEATCSPSQQLILDNSGASTKHKLSKQNCDSLFGVVDVEKLADFYGASVKGSLDFKFGANKGFEDGFNKAMELNRFTLEDIKRAISFGQGMDLWKEEEQIDKFIQSLQQPTEIDVEIESKIAINGHTILGYELDSEGCLILKKI